MTEENKTHLLEIVDNIYSQIDDEMKLKILAHYELSMKIEEDEENLLDEEGQQFFKDELFNKVLKDWSPHCYIKLKDIHLFRDEYCIFGDTDDEESLFNNLDAFGVNIWLCTFFKKCYILEDHEPLGIFFIKIPKWQREEAKTAFENYFKRMNWKYSDFYEICAGAISELELVE